MDDYRIDTTSLSVAAKERVLQYIATAELGPGRKLPREEDLAKIIGVSRITLRTALNELAVTGIVTRQQGRGTFVSAAAGHLKTALSPMGEFMDLIRASGYEPKVQSLSARTIQDADLAERLGRPRDTPLLRTAKVFLADGQFCSLVVDHLAADEIGDEAAVAAASDYPDSIFRFIAAHTGRRISRDHVTLAAVSGRDARTDADGSDLVPTTPLLRIDGINYDQDDRPVMLAREYVDTSIIEFSLIRQRQVRYP